MEIVPMNQKQAIVRKERKPREIRVIQPAWWVDEAVAIEIRSKPVATRNEGNSCDIAMGRADKRASAPKFPRHRMALRKELVC
jgi:hypothetical protein